MADIIRLKVLTASRLVVDEQVGEVTAPGALGEFGVLPDHMAFLTLLEPGEVSYKQGASRHYLAVSGGYAEVLNNVVTVLAPAAQFPAEIDVAWARRAREEAEKRIGELRQEGKDVGAVEAALRWAEVRIALAERE